MRHELGQMKDLQTHDQGSLVVQDGSTKVFDEFVMQSFIRCGTSREILCPGWGEAVDRPSHIE